MAEVLITLGIIGIIAALTIPGLVTSYQEKVTITKLKKFYSILSQAYTLAVLENGEPAGWNLIGYMSLEGAKNLAEIFKPQLNIIDEKELTPPESSNGYMYTLADGSKISFETRSANCTSNRGTGPLAQACGLIYYYNDLESRVGGVNHFGFNLTAQGIVPFGTPDDVVQSFDGGCINGGNGDTLACTAWVIYNENMDYLKCDDLNWDTKTKCD